MKGKSIMEIDKFIEELKTLNACGEALMKIRHYKTAQEWWDDTDRGDWMLWLIGKKSGEPWLDKRKKLVLASCQCARLVWDLMPQASKDCIELFERWANGKDIQVEELRKARSAAAHAAPAAAHAAYAAAYAAANAGDAAAYAAAPAAAHAAANAAAKREEILAECAVIVRKAYPEVDVIINDGLNKKNL